MGALIGGWAVGPVVGRRPAGPVREAVHPRSGTRGVLVVVDARFAAAGQPDHEAVARAAAVGHPAIVPLLDAGILDDGTRWYVTAAPPGPVLDPESGCSPRRAALIAEGVARALGALHAAGVPHGLVGAATVVPAAGRHRDGGAGSTLLLDTGIAALLGAGTAALAAASGAVLPEDRGPAADVHALGALLLRLLTAAAPSGPALAALPVGLRDLLTEMLDDEPRRRPTASAVAGRLAGLREGLPGTAPVDLPATRQPAPHATAPLAAVPRQPATAPVDLPDTQQPAPRAAAAVARQAAPIRPAPSPSAPVRGPATVPTPMRDVPTVRVAAPVAAPVGLTSPGIVPSIRPDSAHAMRTGPIRVVAPDPRPKGLRRLVVAAGGIGLAALLVGVVTHLPLGQDVGIHAAAAGADDAFAGVGAPVGDLAADSAATTSPTATAERSAAVADPTAVASAARVTAPGATDAPTFLKPTAVVPAPLTVATKSSATARATPRSTAGSTPTATTASSPTSSGSTSTGSSGSSGSSSPSRSTPAATTEQTSPPSASSTPSGDAAESSPSATTGTASSSPSSASEDSSTPSATPEASSTSSTSSASDATDSPSPEVTG